VQPIVLAKQASKAKVKNAYKPVRTPIKCAINEIVKLTLSKKNFCFLI